MKKIIIVTGAPLSGKDIHSKLIAEDLKYKLCSSDEIISEEIANKTKIGLIMEKYSQSETQVPDEYLIMLMKEKIINLKEDGIVFNDFPKTINQAKALDSFLFAKKINRPIPVLLETDNTVVVDRMGGNQDSFKMALNSFERKVKPIISYYTPLGLKFDTSAKSVETISEEILIAVRERCSLT